MTGPQRPAPHDQVVADLMGRCRFPAGRALEERTTGLRHWEDLRPGCYDPIERVKDMDINGVYASVNFPSGVTGFGGRKRFAPSVGAP